MDTVIFLSGSTRGATLEAIGRSLGAAFSELDIAFIELSLLDMPVFLERAKSIDFGKVRLVFSFVSMGMEIPLRRDDGSTFDLWQTMGIPFISIHGDSPAYFFDRHIVKDSRFVTVYAFPEHRELRARLPMVNGLLDTSWPFALEEVPKEQIDFKKKKSAKLLFLKNGKDPVAIRRFWRSCLESRVLEALQSMASELESNLDAPVSNQIDDLVKQQFDALDFDIRPLTRLRLFLIAQLDDYLRAVKCTRMVKLLMHFPVEIRGNNWQHIDFAEGKATYIDECDFAKSTQLVRDSLGIIDMSPNTSSHPHDRVMRAYGAHTACLTNKQQFLHDLPHQQNLSFKFEGDDFKCRVEYLLAHPGETLEMGLDVADAYKTRHPASDTVRKLLDSAALVRFDNLHERPPGSQDFFVWPSRIA